MPSGFLVFAGRRACARDRHVVGFTYQKDAKTQEDTMDTKSLVIEFLGGSELPIVLNDSRFTGGELFEYNDNLWKLRQDKHPIYDIDGIVLRYVIVAYRYSLAD